MLRQVKPRTARSKRALEKRAPKPVENTKTALFLRGTTCSQITQDALADLYAMRQTHSKRFHKKNAVHPFEDAGSLTFFSEKNDTSLVLFGSSSKKRPHTITFGRTFDYKMLDMLEFYLDPETFRSISQFKNAKKVPVGTKPLLVFAGTAFESPVPNAFTMAKSMLLDFFRGEATDKIDVEGLQYVVVVSADEPTTTSNPDDPASKPTLHLRCYNIVTKRSGQRLPRVELEEHGPRMDFRLGRTQEPEEALLKEAMRRARTTEERTKKNVSTDVMGDKLGRIHTGKLDLAQLQTRKMKGLKRERDPHLLEDDENDDEGGVYDGSTMVEDKADNPRRKKRKD